MKITAVESHVLLAPNYDPRFTSSAQDSFIVVIRTDDGVTGIGESLEGRLLLFDALASRWHEVRLGRDPACRVCGVAQAAAAD